ncbi:MAG TPA: hypothetical protein VJ279_08595 [Hanamia sp.]|jgi:hypothetical protein|nr:hypothetical protein [Hanamia sp.]
MTELCHCGKPLHYSSKAVEEVINKIIEFKGTRFVEIEQIETRKKYKVDIHYIALHGIQGDKLETYGFEVIKND